MEAELVDAAGQMLAP
jgi:hypothetical protein